MLHFSTQRMKFTCDMLSLLMITVIVPMLDLDIYKLLIQVDFNFLANKIH